MEQVARLCQGFAADSVCKSVAIPQKLCTNRCLDIQPPFVLDHEGARLEATKMIRDRQVWVLEAYHSRGSSIASIVCLTRANDTVTAITKVYTPPEWRQRGYARRLVRKVCEQ